jgi:hypothetical protein
MVLVEKNLKEMLSEIGNWGLVSYKMFRFERDATMLADEAMNAQVDISRIIAQFPVTHARILFLYALENVLYDVDSVSGQPFSFWLFVGEKGLVARIEDYGPGFDWRAVQEKYLAGEMYYQRRGSGFRAYNDFKNAQCSFDENGEAENILELFE